MIQHALSLLYPQLSSLNRGLTVLGRISFISEHRAYNRDCTKTVAVFSELGLDVKNS